MVSGYVYDWVYNLLYVEVCESAVGIELEECFKKAKKFL